MTENQGIIFPLYSDMTKRAIENGKDVFAKFSKRSVEDGDAFYIYGTGEGGARKIIARATVSGTNTLAASEVWKEYGNRLFQNKDEFNEYVRDRRSKKMLILELDDAELLEKPVDPPGNMTVAGLYLDEDMKEDIESKIRG